MVIEVRLEVTFERRLIGKAHEGDFWGVGNVQNLNLNGDHMGAYISKNLSSCTLHNLILE